MKKLMFIVAGIILALAIVSCEKQDKNDPGADALKTAKVTYDVGDMVGPQSDIGIDPVIIDGENRGGNRTCEEVWLTFDPDAVPGTDYMCGDKVDYDDDPEGFASSFPSALNVMVSGIYVSFEALDCIEFVDDLGNSTFWKVGAVIVKGSNAANIYWYGHEEGGGVLADSHLAAPGDKHMVSNLTFCFVPCDTPPEKKIMAAKVWFFQTGAACEEWSWAPSTGTTYPYNSVSDWCDVLGFNVYEDTDGTPIALGAVGEIEVVDGNVIITMAAGYEIYSASVYVGDGNDLDFEKCPNYKSDLWNYKAEICNKTYTLDHKLFE